MSMAYIRATYNVPAKRGGRIEFTASDGAKYHGTIKSARAGRLRVKMDYSAQTTWSVHPTWNIRYLPADGERQP